MRVAFVVGDFPVVTETFLINQVADLLDREVEVEIFAFGRGARENVSEKFFTHDIEQKVHYLEMPRSWPARLLAAIPIVFRILRACPGALFRLFDVVRHGRNALSLRYLFWVAPFLAARFDLVHAHFGPVARDYLVIREILGLKQKLIVTFYGYDASLLFKTKPAGYYDELKRVAARILVMSNDMRARLIANGFNRDKIEVLPVSIDVASYPYRARALQRGECGQIVSVGRFVEKKGFDDLLRALAIVRERTARAFRCLIIGDGVLRETLVKLTEELKLEDIVEFRGYMRREEIVQLFLQMHVFAQPSKTSAAGDME